MKTSIPAILITFSLVCFGLLPKAHAVVPPPDGGYPGANTAEGENALLNLTSGINNTAVGANALRDNTTGGYNVGIGSGALASNTTGNFNMAIGTEALTNNNANFNLAIGFRVGFMNTTGNHLTGIGAAALRNNTTAGFNTAIGADALRENTTGERNTAIGADALSSNIVGFDNTAIGVDALSSNTIGRHNQAVGRGALFSNSTGGGNTANGADALFSNTTGHFNTATGGVALINNTSGQNNTAVGYGALLDSTSSNNTALGSSAGQSVTTATNVICIGAGVDGANVNNSCFIGNIRDVTTAIGDAVPIVIDSAGQLGTASSSRRFKQEIKPMDKASEAVLALKPVTFHYKSDKADTPQFGLIAEEVAKVNPDLVVRDKNGEMYTVRYDAVNAMLLNEFLKEHRKVEEQEKTIAQLQSGMTALLATVREQAAQIQKVSEQIQMRRSAPLVVNNNQ
jgi:trimeric autotransporter adhesin